ncbi:MAG: hypothetical protein ACRETH_11780, partial [Steroidobacteraceae bacterium]
PDPRRKLPTPLDRRNEHRAPVTRLVSQVHTLSDPRFSNRDTLRHSYLVIANDYRDLANTPPDGPKLFLDRVWRYQRLADALA